VLEGWGERPCLCPSFIEFEEEISQPTKVLEGLGEALPPGSFKKPQPPWKIKV